MKKWKWKIPFLSDWLAKQKKLAEDTAEVREENSILRQNIKTLESIGGGPPGGEPDGLLWDRLVRDDSLDPFGTLFGVRGDNPLVAPMKEEIPGSGVWKPLSFKEQIDGIASHIREGSYPFSVTGGSSRYIRRDLSEGDRMNARGAALWNVWSDPIAKNIINSLVAYVLGRGVQFSTPSEEINEVLRGFWHSRENRMELRQLRMLRLFLIYGESIPLLYKLEKPPYIKLRFMNPDEVGQIYYDKKDQEEIYFITRERWLDDGKFGKEIYRVSGTDESISLDSDSVAPKKDGELDEEIECGLFPLEWDADPSGRGLPLLFPVLKWLKLRRDFVINRMFRNREAARIAWAVRYHTAAAEAADGQQTRGYRQAPTGGAALVETPEKTWRVIEPRVLGGDASPDYKMILKEIGAGVGEPPHVFAVDSEDTNYASIRIADTPFAQRVLGLQDVFREQINFVLMAVVRQAVKRGGLPQTVEVPEDTPEHIGEMVSLVRQFIGKRVSGARLSESVKRAFEELKKSGEIKMKKVDTLSVPINIQFPDVTREDPVKQGELVKILMELGLSSEQTAREKVGLQHEVEVQRLADEEAERQTKADERADDEDARFQRTGKLPKKLKPGEKEPDEEDDEDDEDEEE